MNPQRSSTILKLEPNVPTELALQFANGMDVSGNYGPQVLFTLTNNRRLYVDLDVAKEIRSLSLAPHQPFIITRGIKGASWTVERKPVKPETRPSPDAGVQTSRQVEHALKTVIAAAASAELFAKDIGYPVSFSEESIKSLACTLLIGMGRAA
jgi:hypothetical protein